MQPGPAQHGGVWDGEEPFLLIARTAQRATQPRQAVKQRSGGPQCVAPAHGSE